MLLTRPEGSSGNTAVAAVYASPDDPSLNLDLYVSDYVSVTGTEDLAPAACRSVTRRLIEVRELEVIPLPPGGQRSAAASPSGNRTSTAIE